MGGRYRSISRSYSPPSPRRESRSPPRRRKRYDDPRDRYPGPSAVTGGRGFRDRRFDGRSGLLVRNISLDARAEDLRIPFERFGPVKDVYLPKNYYTGEPRGFGFVKFHDPDDAAEAKYQMDHQLVGGREITIVFAEENRKTPQEMRTTGRNSSGRHSGGGYRRRSPGRSPRHRQSYSRSPSPLRRNARGRERTSLDKDSLERSVSPRGSRRNKYNKSSRHSTSPRGNGKSTLDRSSPLLRAEHHSSKRSSSPAVAGSVPKGSENGGTHAVI
ncbi:hypothetical protein ZOSMA_5G01080 [Zostera marina]|uniref:RRM domain-containing protein n=1 Tax=Zostera marina TaxID=29655 RepID=A0A0K9NUE1_ZOSMR|nr:hypothetical protein ZOSMA_5G01080 [Zostera marina]